MRNELFENAEKIKEFRLQLKKEFDKYAEIFKEGKADSLTPDLRKELIDMLSAYEDLCNYATDAEDYTRFAALFVTKED